MLSSVDKKKPPGTRINLRSQTGKLTGRHPISSGTRALIKEESRGHLGASFTWKSLCFLPLPSSSESQQAEMTQVPSGWTKKTRLSAWNDVITSALRLCERRHQRTESTTWETKHQKPQQKQKPACPAFLQMCFGILTFTRRLKILADELKHRIEKAACRCNTSQASEPEAMMILLICPSYNSRV